MNKAFKLTLLTFLFIGILFISACKTAFVWDPTGVWSVNITYLDYGSSYVETFTFAGSESSGTVTGYTVYGVLAPQSGTYIKAADFTININYDFWGYGDHLVFNFTGTSSESAPNIMSGTGQWYINGLLENDLSWTANKTTNLQ